MSRFLGYTDESAAAADLRSYARISGAATINKLPMFSGLGPTRISDSVYGQADSGHQVIIGVGATVAVGQVATKPAIAIGEGAFCWGDSGIAIGKGASNGQAGLADFGIAIGFNALNTNKNGIRIGAANAGVGAFDDSIAIGSQSGCTRTGVAIGKLSSAVGQDGIAIGTSASSVEGSSVAIGRGANCANSGLGTPNKNIAIGDGANCSSVFAGAEIAIGLNARSSGQFCVAIGAGAQITGTAIANSIVIGHGAVSARSNELVFGDNASPITLVTVRPGAAAAVKHRTGGTGEWMIRNLADTADIFSVDESLAADNMRLLLWDVTGAVLKRVTRGALDSGGAGKRLLLIAN